MMNNNTHLSAPAKQLETWLTVLLKFEYSSDYMLVKRMPTATELQEVIDEMTEALKELKSLSKK